MKKDTPKSDKLADMLIHPDSILSVRKYVKKSLKLCRKLERQRNAYAFVLQRTHYNLIGRHGWGDPDAVLIGETMGWDSGNLGENF